ncbi:MAG: hypothetical protein MR379_06055 [Clostridiales bacterium]|nr:hypothetical protein [Clostridiales bacterium]MDD7595887.1 hypothetical protein [Clostridiales bacterium]
MEEAPRLYIAEKTTSAWLPDPSLPEVMTQTEKDFSLLELCLMSRDICINQAEAIRPHEISSCVICIDSDIAEAISAVAAASIE